MNLRSKGLVEKLPDLKSILRGKRERRAELRKPRPQQITNYFAIKHINTSIIGKLKYYPKYKLITGTSGENSLFWNLIEDQVYENSSVNDQLGLKQNFDLVDVSIIESTNSIIKWCHFRVQMFDFKTFQKIENQVLNQLKYGYVYMAENFNKNQITFQKSLNIEFDGQVSKLKDQQKYIMIFSGYKKLNMYFNTKYKTKLVRGFKNDQYNVDSFSGRIFSTTNHYNNFSETMVIDMCTMKIIAFIQKEDSCLKSLYINQLGLFVILYTNSLDIFDSSSFQLVGSEQLLDNKLHHNKTFQMAFDGSQLLIFYQTIKKKFKTSEQADYQEM